MIKIIPENFNSEVFNQVAGHPLQSWQWGEARQSMGIDVLRLGEFDGDKLETVFTITFHKIPHTSFMIGYLPRSVVPSKEALEMLTSEGKRRKAIFIKIEPYIRKSQENVIANPAQRGEAISEIATSSTTPRDDKLRKSPHGLFPAWTQTIDLTQSEEELLSAMKPKTRYNIKVAQKHGVEIREMTSAEGFEIFSKLYFQTTSRQKYHGHNKAYHQIVFETLQKDIAHTLIAFYKGEPLSAYELFLFDDKLYYPYGGSSTEHREVMAANLLMWEAIRFGKANGAKVFDMWGSLPPNYASTPLSTSDWAGFTRFKEGFGGKFVEFVGSYDLVIDKGLYSIYGLIQSLRQRIL